jgi:outer membrane protein OmpA-like peptidoglycan-associated protein/opacity protein-like surface antigen
MNSGITNWARRFGFVAVAALITGATPALAAEGDAGWYLGAQGYYSQLGDSDDSVSSSSSTSSPGTPSGLLGLIFPNTIPPLTPALIPPICTSPLGALCSGGTPPASSSSSSSRSVGFTYKGGYAAGGVVGYSLANGFRPELDISYSQANLNSFSIQGLTDTNAQGRVKALRFFLNGWYDFKFNDVLKPYVGGGLGAQRTKLDLYDRTFNTTAFAYQLGAGLNWWFTPKTTISLDYRFVDSRPEHDLGNGSTLNTKLQANQIGLGLKYYFKDVASAEPAPAPPVEVVPPVEAPPPRVNKCPNLPAGIPPDMLDADGCPLDSDGDGIPDYLDECPHSPPGAKVLPNGCALKGDCRKPRAGEKVDANGCALDKAFILRGVKFEFDSDRLTPESKTILNGVAETLKSYTDISVEVAGHTDSIGTDAYNLGLSERRAIAVKTYLEARGAEGKRLSPVGYGETVPIDTNETDEGRENNRRVEFKVTE